jgi:hypothetical protein
MFQGLILRNPEDLKPQIAKNKFQLNPKPQILNILNSLIILKLVIGSYLLFGDCFIQ